MTEEKQRSKVEVLPEGTAEIQKVSESAIGGVAFLIVVIGLATCAIFG